MVAYEDEHDDDGNKDEQRARWCHCPRPDRCARGDDDGGDVGGGGGRPATDSAPLDFGRK